MPGAALLRSGVNVSTFRATLPVRPSKPPRQEHEVTATATRPVRATALPLPLPPVAVTPAFFRTGTIAHGLTAWTVVIAGRTLGLAATGTVYDTCPRCNGRGRMEEYAGVYGGECFQCRYRGAVRFADTLDAAQRKLRSAQARKLREDARWEAGRPAREAAEAQARAEAREQAHAAALREQARRDERAAVEAAQRWTGTVGGKVTVTGRVTVNAHVESRYGSSRLVVVEGTGADEGVTLKTFGTSDWHYDVEAGDEVTVRATVKEHDTYNGTKQTVVVRPKAVQA